MIRASFIASACALALLVASGVDPAASQSIVQPQNANTDEVWSGLVTDVFGDRPLLDGTGIVTLDAPIRAEDAAIVPMTIEANLPPGDTRTIRKITLVIDQNPAPVAAEFELGERAAVDRIETRVRVNAYTKVHVVAEASDGALYMTERFVKASGGCSAPAGKDPALAMQNLGKMKVRQFAPETAGTSGKREAQVMVRHPNNSGLQMDQVTRHYIPAFFVDQIEVRQGDELILRMTGGISLSEDPNIRFTYVPNGAETMTVRATDTEQHVYESAWPVDTPS